MESILKASAAWRGISDSWAVYHPNHLKRVQQFILLDIWMRLLEGRYMVKSQLVSLNRRQRGQSSICPRCLELRQCWLNRLWACSHLSGQLYSASMAGSAISDPSPARPMAKIV